MLDIGSDRGIIKKSGAFYSYGETKLGQGRDNARIFLKGNDKLLKEIEKEVRKSKKGDDFSAKKGKIEEIIEE